VYYSSPRQYGNGPKQERAFVHIEWREVPKQWDKWDHAAVLAVAAGLVAALLLHFEWPFLRCGFRWLTGWPCISCGLTRATLSLAKGRVWEAFFYHPLGALLELVWLWAASWGVLSRLFSWKRPWVHLSKKEKRYLWAAGVLLLLLSYAQVLSYHRPWE
jgi:hypothetical protein